MALHVNSYSPPAPSRSEAPTSPGQPKPTIILIHGGASSSRLYKDMIPYLLNRGYPLLAPDLAGHGQSTLLGPFEFSRSTSLLHDTITAYKDGEKPAKTVIVGISLGGQAVLDLLAHHPSIADAAVVSGATIHPPDDKAQGEIPHIPSSQEWMHIIMEDLQLMGGMEKAQALQAESFGFRLEDDGEETEKGVKWPPVLIVVGEKDTSMARRDFAELSALVKARNERSEGTVMQDAWHNHSIDVPERFAELVDGWVKNVFGDELTSDE